MRVRLRGVRVRVRLRRRGAVSGRAALSRQSARLAPFRDRLLRRVAPGLRGAALDACCGHGDVAAELLGRVRGPVIALDRDMAALRDVDARCRRVRGDALALPLQDACVDLAVTQACWLWLGDVSRAARELRRVLADRGALIVLGERDFGGAVEHPPESATAPAWIAALRRAGGDPFVARAIPGALRRAGFARVETEVFGQVASPEETAALREDERELLGADAPDPSPPSDDALVFIPTFGLIAWVNAP